MSRKNKVKNSRKRTSPGLLKRWFAESGSQWSKAIGRWLGCLVILIAVISGMVVGLRYLDRYVKEEVASRREIQWEVMLADPQPQWASDELKDAICLSSGLSSDDFLLDEGLVGKWAGNLALNPWVKHLNQVRKRYDGLVVIDCQLREPIGLVEQAGRVYYIDDDGVILPEMPIYGHLVRLEGFSEELPEPGQYIKSKSLVAGLQVLAMIREVDANLLSRERLWGELAVLDVGNHEGRVSREDSHLTLYTKNNTPIRWGAAVGRERPFYEAPANFKLASLYRVFKKYYSLDRYSYVDLRNLRKERSDPVRRSG